MPTNALDLLKKDHDEVRELLAELCDTTTRATKSRPELLEKVEQELEIHTRIEEEIFCPAFRDPNGKAHDELYFEAVEEHCAVDALVLLDLKKTAPNDDRVTGRAKVLRELVEHHAAEEEQNIFPRAAETFSQPISGSWALGCRASRTSCRTPERTARVRSSSTIARSDHRARGRSGRVSARK